VEKFGQTEVVNLWSAATATVAVRPARLLRQLQDPPLQNPAAVAVAVVGFAAAATAAVAAATATAVVADLVGVFDVALGAEISAQRVVAEWPPAAVVVVAASDVAAGAAARLCVGAVVHEADWWIEMMSAWKVQKTSMAAGKLSFGEASQDSESGRLAAVIAVECAEASQEWTSGELAPARRSPR